MLKACSPHCILLVLTVLTGGRLVIVYGFNFTGISWRSSDPDRVYWGYDSSVNISNATQRCIRDGGQLLVVEDPVARDYISGFTWRTYWIGLFRNAAGKMQWSDASPAGTLAWGPGEPQPVGESCASLSAGDRFPGRVKAQAETVVYLQSSHCRTYRSFICATDQPKPSWASSTLPHPTRPRTYLALAGGPPLTWQDALSFCQRSNGTLATINSDSLIKALHEHLLPIMTFEVGPQPFNVSALRPATQGNGRIENGKVVYDSLPGGNGQSAAGGGNGAGVGGTIGGGAAGGSGGLTSENGERAHACTQWQRLDDLFVNNTACSSGGPFLCYSGNQDLAPSITRAGSKELLFFSYRATYAFAQQTCAAHNASLLVVESERENALLQELAAKYARGQSLFIGIHGNNMTVFGTPIRYHNFLPFPPSFEIEPLWTKDGCTVVTLYDSSTGHLWPGAWWPISCLQTRPFVCARGQRPPSRATAGKYSLESPKRNPPPSRPMGLPRPGFIALLTTLSLLALLLPPAILLLYRHRTHPPSTKTPPPPHQTLPPPSHQAPHRPRPSQPPSPPPHPRLNQPQHPPFPRHTLALQDPGFPPPSSPPARKCQDPPVPQHSH